MTLFSRDVYYVRISPDLIVCRNVTAGLEHRQPAPTPFTTQRLLVGAFEPAAETLRTALRRTRRHSLLRPAMLLHPLERIDGGLSEIETRVLVELAASVGAATCVVHVGPELSDREVIARIDGAARSNR